MSAPRRFTPRITPKQVKHFQKTVYDYYLRHKRNLPWRKTRQPYHILVSEVMLQQTQVSRVVKKYVFFTRCFPTLQALAQSPLRKIMQVWQGLGYNRRALLLKRLAQEVVLRYERKIPRERRALRTLPGIGEATSGAICAFAFNQPEVFIETNIRSVFIHFFFKDTNKVCDQKILPYIEKTLDKKNPREWYYALMDYGAYLKDTVPNPNRKSLHYKRQSLFEGSNRQIRGRILKALLRRKRLSQTSLYRQIRITPERFTAAIESLRADRLVKKEKNYLSIHN